MFLILFVCAENEKEANAVYEEHYLIPDWGEK